MKTLICCLLVLSLPALAASPSFRENDSRWYVQTTSGYHYIGNSWGSKDACEANLASPAGEFIARFAAFQLGGTPRLFCGLGRWEGKE